ncbi:unknown [Roseburia sp. CAG:380]|jgi:hypothetical protein|uniref:hypothetical protein n=1 Tax=Roseburia sp. AM59-24XD TaxID=2293138 RepID=UPI000339FDEA|nr:hypothetical protein [Roseburia sp. AM59-24XD]MBS5666012.1 hypothetical protein [Roseburia sp.]CDC93042.1 unknown [Roseburia sp. CAG:380]
MCKNKTEQTSGSSVHVEVNVTKIVKYVCLTGIAIVGIIFGCNAWAEVQKGNSSIHAE